MPLKYDLHTHSTASDGTLSPAGLVARAATAGVNALALTDHDTTAGIQEAVAESRRRGIWLIPGVEVSVTWESRVIHILGLGVDPSCATLQAGLGKLVEFRNWRAEEMGRRLAKAGIPGAFDGARALSDGRLISRTHFARYLVEKGYVSSVRKVFQRYLVHGKPGYVNGRWADLEEAVSWIRTAGGHAVVAHPARYRLTRSGLRRLLSEFACAGGVGLEVISGSHSRDDNFKMAAFARDFGLLSSAGSDYHGPDNPWIDLGRLPDLPDTCVPVWQDWALEQARMTCRI